MVWLFFSFLSSSFPDLPTLPDCPVSYFESFSSRKVEYSWDPSGLPNYTGVWQIEKTIIPRMSPLEHALVIKSRSSYSAVSHGFRPPIYSINKTLVLQYEMRPQNGFSCSGAYIKILSDPNFKPRLFSNETEYAIMFGPDRCTESNRVHFIYSHFHPIRKVFLKKSVKDPPKAPVDPYTHLYTLIVRPNNTFSILIDNIEKRNGSLFFDFEPPLLEPREIRNSNGEKVRNPNYFMDLHPSNFPDFTGIGFEIWAVNNELAFSNVLIAHDENAVVEWNRRNFIVRQKYQLEEYQEDEEEEEEIGFNGELRFALMRLKEEGLALIREYCVVFVILMVILVMGVICFQRRKRKSKAQ
jgi:hypothetical protein